MRGRIALLRHFVQNASRLCIVLRSFGSTHESRVALISARSMFKVPRVIALYADECFGNGIEMLLSRSDDWFLSRRLLPNRARRRGTAHGLRASHGGIFGLLRFGWERLGHTASGVGFSRIEARRQVVRLRHSLEKRAGPQPGSACGSGSNACFRARVRHAGRTKGARGNASLTNSADRSRLNPIEFATTLRTN